MSVDSSEPRKQDLVTIPAEVVVVRVEVTDSGPGIKADDLQGNKLFSPYVQPEIGHTQGGKGTGLGLALVRHIVSLSGGRLGVRTTPGVGSTFYVEMQYGVSRTSYGVSRTSYGTTGRGFGSTRSEITITASLPAKSPISPLENPSLPTHPAVVHLQSSSRPSTAPALLNRENSFPLENYARPLPMALQKAVKAPSAKRRVVPSPSHPQTPGDQKAAGAPTSRIHNTSDADPLCVLLIDDDPVTRKVMSRMLTRLGARTWEAENGQVGFQMLTGVEEGAHVGDLPERFDLCFLDNQVGRIRTFYYEDIAHP